MKKTIAVCDIHAIFFFNLFSTVLPFLVNSTVHSQSAFDQHSIITYSWDFIYLLLSWLNSARCAPADFIQTKLIEILLINH